ncbi:hypothetical protein PCASD_16984 [Puccinia coronata f. sp. avenae]|uniref:Uncharacterized protein n=1 Tax=Puccinia coronata f. sp. avenae TaxID=200324 RepID=A0A2N5U2Y4_9BASI|nr:hypothetical protein PCASD_16984 [Puccinia coronata f. sp. avenae]
MAASVKPPYHNNLNDAMGQWAWVAQQVNSTIQGIVLPSALQITTTTSASEIAPAMHNLASPDILFTTPSASQRGGRTTTPSASCKGATTNFICVVNFTIFCPEKKQTKTKKDQSQMEGL